MKVLLSLFLLIGCLSCTQVKAQAGIITQDVATFKKTIASKKVQLLDVRTPAEFSEGNITGATNMDVKSNQFKDMAGKWTKRNRLQCIAALVCAAPMLPISSKKWVLKRFIIWMVGTWLGRSKGLCL